MSTEFASTLEADSETFADFDDSVRFVRFGSGVRTKWERGTHRPDEAPTGNCSFEFGTMTNFLACKALAEMGSDWFGPGQSLTQEDGAPAPGTVEWFDAMVRQGRATFGQFPITVAAGSPTMSRFSMEDPR